MLKSPTAASVLIILCSFVLGTESIAGAIGEFFQDLFDSNADNCFYAVRHRSQPSPDLEAAIAHWPIDGLQSVNGTGTRLSKDCSGTFYGCQTHSCNDAKGNPIFVLNLCAPSPTVENGRCFNQELDYICMREGGQPNCKICLHGLCNEGNTEMQTVELADFISGMTEENGTDSANTGETAPTVGNGTDSANTGETAPTVGNGMENANTGETGAPTVGNGMENANTGETGAPTVGNGMENANTGKTGASTDENADTTDGANMNETGATSAENGTGNAVTDETGASTDENVTESGNAHIDWWPSGWKHLF